MLIVIVLFTCRFRQGILSFTAFPYLSHNIFRVTIVVIITKDELKALIIIINSLGLLTASKEYTSVIIKTNIIILIMDKYLYSQLLRPYLFHQKHIHLPSYCYFDKSRIISLCMALHI